MNHDVILIWVSCIISLIWIRSFQCSYIISSILKAWDWCFPYRTAICYLLVNLAVSDISFAVFVAPNHVLKKTFTHPEGASGSELCRMLTNGNLAWVGAASSSITLVAIAIERYYTVMGPLGSKGKLTKRKVKVSKQKYICETDLGWQIRSTLETFILCCKVFVNNT